MQRNKLWFVALMTLAASAAAQTGTVPLDAGTPPSGLTNSNITVSNGNVGIGTTSPAYPLDVNGAIRALGAAGYLFSSNSNVYLRENYGPQFGLGGSASSWGANFTNSNGTSVMYVRSDGNIGIGTTSPISALTLAGLGSLNPNPNTGSQINYPGEGLTFVNNAPTGSFELGGIRMVQPTGYYLDRGDMVFTVGTGAFGTLDAVTIQATGNVGIGTTSPGATLEVNGNVKLTANSGASITFADGTTQSTAWSGTLCGGDYAESVDITGERTQYEPGDVLVVDPDHPGHFLKASERYSTSVAGIYSTKPGLIGRRQTVDPKLASTEIPMAMIGVVPTKVTAENGPIHPGDILVTSSSSGHAMKGTDRSLFAGAVVGKALGSLASGTGVIEVLVSLQ